MTNEINIEPLASAYDLEGSLSGQRLFIVGPSPSISLFPIEELGGRNTLAINSAIELMSPRWWLWSDKRFSWIYKGFYKRITCELLVPFHQVEIVRKRGYRGKLWIYTSQMKLNKWEPQRDPYWYAPSRLFLPGRASVFSVAISLAFLMRPADVVLVGIDFDPMNGYYAPGVKLNPGPKDRSRAIMSGFSWFRKSMNSNLWPGLRVLSTTKSVADRVKDVEYVTQEEALR